MTSDDPGNRLPQTIPKMLAKSAEMYQNKLAMKIKGEDGKWQVKK